MARVTKLKGDDACWIFGNIEPGTYGSWSWNGVRRQAHRWSFQLFKGDLIEGSEVCHTCDNERCVRPEHIWQGNKSENMKDCYFKGRMPHATVWNKQGEAHPSAKITERVAMEILRKHRHGWTHKQIANWCELSLSGVGHIISGYRWPHLSRSTEEEEK